MTKTHTHTHHHLPVEWSVVDTGAYSILTKAQTVLASPLYGVCSDHGGYPRPGQTWNRFITGYYMSFHFLSFKRLNR